MEGICMHQINAILAIPSTPIYFKPLHQGTTTYFTTRLNLLMYNTTVS